MSSLRLISAMLPKRVKVGLKAAFRRPAPPRMRLDLVRAGGFDVAFRPGTSDEDVLNDSFEHDIFFPAVPEYAVGPGHVVIDVGAHIGTFSLLAARRAPGVKVYAIEACRETYHFLTVNARMNRLDNVDASHLALSDGPGTVTLHYDHENWGHTIVRPLGVGGETVPADSLANFMAAKGIDWCDFMKFNCEGAEFPILLSTPADVLRRVGAMLVLYHCDLYTGADDATLLRHLEAAGFRTAVRNRQSQRGWIVATRAVASA